MAGPRISANVKNEQAALQGSINSLELKRQIENGPGRMPFFEPRIGLHNGTGLSTEPLFATHSVPPHQGNFPKVSFFLDSFRPEVSSRPSRDR